MNECFFSFPRCSALQGKILTFEFRKDALHGREAEQDIPYGTGLIGRVGPDTSTHTVRGAMHKGHRKINFSRDR